MFVWENAKWVVLALQDAMGSPDGRFQLLALMILLLIQEVIYECIYQ